MIGFTADWRHLVYLNYEVDPALLQPHLPHGVELDSYNGDHYLSIVGFIFSNLKFMGISVPEYQSFTQVQSQFYVRKKTPSEWRRGTVVLRQLVPQALTKRISRMLAREEVSIAETKYAIHFEEGSRDHMGRPIADEVATYEWRSQKEEKWQSLSFRATGLPAPLSFGPVEQFLGQRPFSFLKASGTKTRAVQIEHPEWFYWDSAKATLNADPASLGLTPFSEILVAPPANAFLIKGSQVQISLPSRA